MARCCRLLRVQSVPHSTPLRQQCARTWALSLRYKVTTRPMRTHYTRPAGSGAGTGKSCHALWEHERAIPTFWEPAPRTQPQRPQPSVRKSKLQFSSCAIKANKMLDFCHKMLLWRKRLRRFVALIGSIRCSLAERSPVQWMLPSRSFSIYGEFNMA